MMIISEEEDSHYEGQHTDKAICIDETSMGEPWTEFGKWFGERYSKDMTIMEQIAGMKGHNFIEFTPEDAKACKAAFKRLQHTDGLEIDFDSLVGKHISTENW